MMMKNDVNDHQESVIDWDLHILRWMQQMKWVNSMMPNNWKSLFQFQFVLNLILNLLSVNSLHHPFSFCVRCSKGLNDFFFIYTMIVYVNKEKIKIIWSFWDGIIILHLQHRCRSDLFELLNENILFESADYLRKVNNQINVNSSSRYKDICVIVARVNMVGNFDNQTVNSFISIQNEPHFLVPSFAFLHRHPTI